MFEFDTFYTMVIKTLLILGAFSCYCKAKTFLVKNIAAEDHNENQYDDTGNDYMETIAQQTVTAGEEFSLMCNSSQEIKECYFSNNDGNTIYRVRKGARFHQRRLQCVCDVRMLLFIIIVMNSVSHTYLRVIATQWPTHIYQLTWVECIPSKYESVAAA